MIRAGNKAAIIFVVLWQRIVAEDFMLRAMRLMRMKSSWW